jgi:alpha,alpha-trehalase
MHYLFDQIKKVLDRLRVAKRIFLFLDYDGTLTPIVPHPHDAYLSEETKNLLLRIKKNPRVLLTIVSGRSLKDIRNRVGLKGIYYIGNHGLEIFGPKQGTKRFVSKKIIRLLEGIRDRLNDQYRDVEGVLIEDKGCILAVHYRNVDPRWVPSILIKLKQEMMNSAVPLCLGFGKYVIEVKPLSSVNKGVAVLELLNHIDPGGVLPLYMGDDQTDEDAFRALKGKGVTIFVGSPGLSSARYYVKDPSEVSQFLESLNKE